MDTASSVTRQALYSGRRPSSQKDGVSPASKLTCPVRSVPHNSALQAVEARDGSSHTF